MIFMMLIITYRILQCERFVSHAPDLEGSDPEGGFLAEPLVPAVGAAGLRGGTLSEGIRVHPNAAKVELAAH